MLSLAIAGLIVSVLLSLVRVEEDRRRRFANVGDGEWNVVQATAQLDRFSAVVEYFMRGGDAADHDRLSEQYEIVWSRFRLLIGNPANNPFGAIADAQGELASIETKLTELEAVVQALRPGDDAGYQRITAFIAEHRPWLAKLTKQVHDGRVNIDTQVGEIGGIYNETLLFLTLTVLSTGLLIFRLARGFRRAHISLEEAKEARVAAQIAQQELRAVVDAVPAMIAAWDVGGRCLFANRLCTEFHGVGAGQVPGRNVAKLGFLADRRRTVSEVARSGSPAPFSEHLAANAEGDERVLLSTLVPIKGSAGEVLSIVGVSLDVTERNRREVALAEARDRLERQAAEMRELAETAQRANQSKSMFLAMMSHEIRTPMNALLGFADLLANSPLLPDQRHYVAIIRETGRQLLALLSDVLDFTRVEQGGIEVGRVPFRLDELIRSLQPVAQMLLSEKAVAFGLELHPDVPCCVRGDPVRVKQVLNNLLSNAAKFTTRGRVSLTVEPAPGMLPHPAVRFSVTDTGIGVDTARLPRLFKVFSQAEDDTHRRFGGTGLGLAICRELVELMGGQIGVESEPERGSTFWFVLPLEPVAEHERDSLEARVAPPQAAATLVARRLRILVVDDVDTNLQLLRALVRRAGHKVSVATNGVDAVQAVGRESPDLVLMDVNMPGIDGLEATRRIRAMDGASGRVPIVALTANALASDIEACRAAGMDDHLAKPIDVAALTATLARFAAATVSPGPVPTSERETPVLNTTQLDRLAEAIGADLVASLFRRMGRDATAAIAAMGRAREAGDRAGVARAAHRLARLAGSLGAAKLHESARSVGLAAQAGPSGEAVGATVLGEVDRIRMRTTAAFEAWLAARSDERQVVNA